MTLAMADYRDRSQISNKKNQTRMLKQSKASFCDMRVTTR
jgi:hypothetical protein